MIFDIYSVNTNRTLNFDSEKIHCDVEALLEYIDVFRKTALSAGQEYLISEKNLACGWIKKNAYAIQILDISGALLFQTAGFLSNENMEETMAQFFEGIEIELEKNILPKCKCPVVLDYITPKGMQVFDAEKTIEYLSKPLAAIAFEYLESFQD